MRKEPLEPGLLKILRYYTGLVALAFLFLLLLPGPLKQGGGPDYKATLLFIITYATIFLYLSIPGLKQKLKGIFLPAALLASSLIPIAITNTKYRELLSLGQSINHLDDTINLIILLIFPLIITAWQYSFPVVFLFFVVMGFLDPLLLILVNKNFSPEMYAVFNVGIIRILAFGAVGFMITELRGMQRLEREKREEANRKLKEYAGTIEALAESRERNRLSRDLHDTLAHTLSGLSIQLEAAAVVIPPEETEILQMVKRSQETVRSGLGETRRALKALRASPLEDLGLLPALEYLGENTRQRTEAAVVLHLPGEVRELPDKVEEAIYRIAQEALENALRHARAGVVTLDLDIQKKAVSFTVHDDGKGFDSQSPPGDVHFGLRGMRERAAAAGGNFAVTSQSGRGTRVEFTWQGEF